MRTKIIVGTVVTALISTSLFAAGKNCDNSNKMGNQQKQMQQNQKMKGQGHSKSGFKMQKMFQSLNLTKEQQTKVDLIMNNHMKNRVTMADAFSKTGFDKEKFINISSQKRDNMIKSRANMIEEIYRVLNDEQKNSLLRDALKVEAEKVKIMR